MDGNLYTEQLIFHYILGNTLYVDKCRAEYFSLAYVRAAFCVVKPHIIRFNEVPSGPQVIELMKQSGATLISPQDQQSVTEEIILSLWQYRSKLREYSEDWLKDQTDCFLTFKSMMWGLEQTISYVKSTRNDVDVTNYKEITDKVKNIFTRETSIELTDSGRGYDLYDPKAHKTKQMARFSTGYQFIDLCAKGGYWEGSLWVFLGALFWKWVTRAGALTSMVGGTAAYCIAMAAGFKIAGLHQITIGLVVAFVLMVVVSLATKPSDAERDAMPVFFPEKEIDRSDSEIATQQRDAL